MANYDAGHYFLTVLMPLREGLVEPGGRVVSHRQCVAELLATLPNGEWLARPGVSDGVYSPCSRSPFARSKRTHFTRLVVIDDLPFNGRQGGDTLLGVLLQTDPLLPQAVDRLPCAWLLWTAEFDATSAADGELDSWLADIWQAMESQWRTLLAHAVGGDAVHGEADFIRHVRRCQIETALPFNDYWPQLPDLQDVSLTLPKYLGIAAVLMLVVVLLGLLLLLFGLPVVWLGLLRGLALAALLALLLAIAWALLAVRSAAASPFPPPQPPAPSSTLPSVLKALHLQRAFVTFAATAQEVDAATLHARFAEFLQVHCPDDLADATQAPAETGF